MPGTHDAWKAALARVRRCPAHLLVSSMIASLAACGDPDRDDPGVQAPLLSVVPDTVSECGSDMVVAEVSWDAERLGIQAVRVEVGQLGNTEPKVFFVGDSKASMLTEQWVRVGTIFILLDQDSGKVLDSREVTGRACL